jgi:hypothetical protein
MLERVVTTVADTEATPRDVLLLQLTNPRADVIRVVIDDQRPTGRASFAAATAALAVVRGLLEGAVRSVGARLGMSVDGARRLAVAYTGAVDVAGSQMGSYVIPIVLPLEPPVPYPAPSHAEHQEAIGREVTLSLADSLQQLSDLATGERETLGQDWILDRPALLALHDAVGDSPSRVVEFSFVWSRVPAGRRPDLDAVTFDASTVSALFSRFPELTEEAVGYVAVVADRSPPEDQESLEYPITFVGEVETLRRSRPTLRGDLHGRNRAVWVELDDRQYQLAILAHTQQALVRVVGVISERGRATPHFVWIESFELFG